MTVVGSEMEKAPEWVPFLLGWGWDYPLRSVNPGGGRYLNQASKATASEGGQNAKKAPGWVPFLLVARRGFEPLLPG